MTTPAVAVLAAAICLGAYIAADVPVFVVLLACGMALISSGRRKPCDSSPQKMWERVACSQGVAVVAAVGLCVSALSAHAWRELDRRPPEKVDGVATVVRDPERLNGAVRADMSMAGRRYQLWARGASGNVLSRELVGEHIKVIGDVEPLAGKATPTLRRRHVAARVNAHAVIHVDDGNTIATSANALRVLVAKGAGSMNSVNSALYTGLVFGDDRQQSKRQREDFRAAGLSHLLAVSGQNVAFLLLVLQPATRRLGLGSRVAAHVFALIVFATVTRWEPSVVRAIVMASVVLFASLSGRKTSSWRTLLIAVGLSVLLDPFLVGSVGFLLSAGACCGMAAFGMPLARRIPGPGGLRNAVAFTLSAQIGVAPVQLAVFGPMPGVAVLANLCAEPLAAFVMMWGMTAGLLAGIAGGAFAHLIHFPTSLALSLLGWIAAKSAHSPIGNWNIVCAVVAAGAFFILPVRHQPTETEIPSRDGTLATRISR